MAYLYILKSKTNGRYYIGSTNNLVRRLEEHNLGKSTYTRLTKPFSLVFCKEYSSLGQARKIEYKIKSFKNRQIIDRIVVDQEIELRT